MPNKDKRAELEQARRQAERQQKMRTYGIIGGIALVVLVALVGGFILISRPAPQATTATGSGICKEIVEAADEGRSHLASPVETPSYQANPPTSGTHNPEWLPAGLYASPQDITKLVHSLEHGYIIIHQKDLSSDELQKLANIVRSDPYKMILNPYPNGPAKVTLAAWDHTQQCSGVDEVVIRAFTNAYRDQGPERGAQ